MNGCRSRALRQVAMMSAALLAILGGSQASGQEGVSGLQGRVLQRSDGALFVYADGLKYRIQPAEVGDELIDAIPEADGAVAQLDQLFSVVSQNPPYLPPTPAPPPPLSLPGPYLAIANPVPGDTLAVGGLNVQGKAFDPVASVEQGSGIDRVQVFLGDRDRGGLYLGDARLGRANPAAEPGSQFALAGWDIVISLPAGAHTLIIYARSAVTGKESTVAVPVRVGRGF